MSEHWSEGRILRIAQCERRRRGLKYVVTVQGPLDRIDHGLRSVAELRKFMLRVPTGGLNVTIDLVVLTVTLGALVTIAARLPRMGQ